MLLCLAPIILTGYLFGGPMAANDSAKLAAPYVDLQTCTTGLGLHATALTSGMYAGGIQYGITWRPSSRTAITFQPRAGISYVDHPVHELPLRTQFEVGAHIVASYDQWHVGVVFLHFSNAGLRDPNLGINMIGPVIGVSF